MTVKVADTAFGTTADIDGKIFHTSESGGYNLIFSYIGYYTDTSYILVEDKNVEKGHIS